MSDSIIYGICDSCEKKYKVPSADKTYPCKACGGTVAVHEVEEERTASERFKARRRTKGHSVGAWIGMGIVLALIGGGLVGYQIGMFGTVHGQEVDARVFGTDIAEPGAALSDAWNGADVEGLAVMHHPTGRSEFKTRLSKISERRGWGATWPKVDKHQGLLHGGTEAKPEKGATVGVMGDTSFNARWQFDGNIKRWFIYDFWVSPTELSPRVEEFRTAWAESDTTALRPFFGESRADKMQEMFDKQIAKAGWTSAHPKLGRVKITGEEEVQDQAGEMLGVKVESVFEAAEDGVLIRWKFDQDTDQWRVSGVRF